MKKLSNIQLDLEIKKLCQRERELLAEILEHIQEATGEDYIWNSAIRIFFLICQNILAIPKERPNVALMLQGS